jgi:glutamine synthetase
MKEHDVDKQAEYVLRTVEERGIRFVRLWFTDVQGFLKSVSISPAELETAFEEGMTFDGSAIDGYARIQEADMLALPDPASFQILPWRPDQQVARMFCDIVTPDGEPFDGDPRYVLRRNLQRAADLGYSFYVGPELEYFYFKDSTGKPEVLDQGGYFDLTPLDVAQEYRRTTITALEQLGIPVEYSHHEVAPSQHEIDLRYTDALTMADNVMTFRLTVKEVAMEHGIYATFMPKPLEEHDGSGFHMHLSLFEGDRNAFYEAGAENGLSKVAEGFIAGVLKHAPEFTAITNQWVNSYKRLVKGFEAPIYQFWARNNQSALVRVPTVKQGKASSTRIEYRAPDSACNPYLAFSVLLAAGLNGIENNYEIPAEVSNNIFEMTTAERKAMGVGRLPSTLDQALDAMESSEFMADALGEHVFSWFLRNKRKEWDRFQHHVSEFELERYLPIL